MDERFAMSQHRFGYAAGLVGETTETWISNSVIGYDLGPPASSADRPADKRIHRFGDDAYTTEPVFVAESDGALEGAGYVVCGLYREAEDRSDLVILDARDLESEPLAVIRLPHRMPHGFHSAWVNGRRVYR